MEFSYKKAGVDVLKIKKSQNSIGKIIASTHKLQKKAKITHGFGHYAGIVEIQGNILLATHTDGVGTKVMIANQMKKFDTIGIDCIAMNVNDIICIGATPISFVDYIAANKNDERIFKQISRPAINKITIAPMCPRVCSSGPICSKGSPSYRRYAPSAKGPIIIPAINSPSTIGIFNLKKTSDIILAEKSKIPTPIIVIIK